MQKSDDHTRTGSRLTTFGCLAGLAVALVIPVTLFVTVMFFGLPTP
ncbi:hypothetical protein ACFVXE_30995 [Streptomyces sp. NPDC058231]